MERTRKNVRRGSRRRLAIGFSLVAAMLVGAAGGSGGPTNAQEPRAAADAPFTDVDQAPVDQARAGADSPAPGPDKARNLQLNRSAMAAVLAGVPAEGSGSLTITLPAPDGTPMAFDVWQTSIMAPELAAKYPEIKTYGGQGVTDPAATIAFDLTPNGFHAQVLAPSGNWYIDPAVHLVDRFHQSFYRDDYTQNPYDFVEINPEEIDELAAERPDPPEASRAGATLRTHRLAVAANSDYTAANGGTRASAMAEITTSIVRVSGIYQKELSVKLQLVGNNNLLVFESFTGSCTSGAAPAISSIVGTGTGTDVQVTTAGAHGLAVGDIVYLDNALGGFNVTWAVSSVDSTTKFRLRGTRFTFASYGAGGNSRKWNPTTKDCDPYNNLTLDIDVNQAVVDKVIGDANYDIGHVYTTGSGGVAGLGVVGITGFKARGTTGLPSPQGDLFYVDFVAHEMGHQYGGSHTFNGSNGSCGGNGSSQQVNRVEPGSGSTIQAYADICGLDDLQGPGQGQAGDGTNASDPYFHSRSFDEIQAHIATIPGAGTTTGTGNSVPTVNAGPDVRIPARTPFFLGATASDGNGDTLTYNFEQRDGGTSSSGRALDNPESTAGPLFRSFPPTSNRTSFFPRLADVRTGNTNQNGTCPALDGSRTRADCWAQYLVPVGTSRNLNFRATVRDNRASGGGVNTDDMVVIVNNTGSRFKVNSPNGGATGGSFTVTWDVAGTSGAPINAATVSIRLSTDGGLTFPTELVHNTPNDGSQAVNTGTSATQARIMVHSGEYVGGSGFFDMSDANINITAVPTAPSAPINPQGAPGDSKVTVVWSPPSSNGNSPITQYTVTSTPGGKTCTTTPPPSPPATSCVVTGLTNGVSYTFAVKATNAIGTGPAATTPAVVPTLPRFVPVPQNRLEDTRPTGKIGNRTNTGTPFKFNVFGRAGLPPTGVDAVSLNITVDRGEQPVAGGGYITVYAHPTCAAGTQPNASNLNFHDSKPIANAVVTPVSASGDVCIFVYGKADLLVDVNGYFPDGSDFTAVPQSRIGDTRPTGKIGNGTTTGTPYKIDVHGLGGIPGTGVDAVSLNITVDRGEQPVAGGGYITVYAHPTCAPGSQPNASNLNFHTSKPIANAVITPINTNGNVCIFVYGKADLLVDVNGYFPDGSDFTAVPQSRIGDTRPTGKIGNGTTTGTPYKIDVHGLGGIPGTGVDAVSLNITVDRGEQPVAGGGYITVYAHPTCAPGSQPNASNLNFHTSKPIANAVITPINTNGNVCIFVYGKADLLVDVNGYFPD